MIEKNNDCDICKSNSEGKSLNLKDGDHLEVCDFHLYTFGKETKDFYADHIKNKAEIKKLEKENKLLLVWFGALVFLNAILNIFLNLKR